MMKKLFTLLMLVPVLGFSAEVQIHDVRVWTGPEGSRVVFDLSDEVKYKIFTLNNPDRIVLDVRDARLMVSPKNIDYGTSLVQKIRSARRGDVTRIVLDTKAAVKPKSLLLPPNSTYGHRLVIDFAGSGEVPEAEIAQAPVEATKQMPATGDAVRDIVVAIDAGHGGEDPGAKGYRGTYEKDIVLRIARKLEDLLRAEPGMRPVLTRDGDYYLSLRKRFYKARDHKADLLVSIHADAFDDARARGSSVYVLSSKGASSEAARWLAEKENASDLIGGVSLDDKDDVLRSVLLDLSQTATLEASMKVGSSVLSQLGVVNRLHRRRVEQAGFMVLKSPDVPSILVETAFISNPDEERALTSADHQQKLASAIMAGIRNYFQSNPPPGTKLAALSAQRAQATERRVLADSGLQTSASR